MSLVGPSATAPFQALPFWLQATVFGAMFALVIVFSTLMKRDATTMKAGGAGIVAFELAGKTDKAHAILANWGTEGRRAARRDLRLDIGLIVGYAVGLSVAFSSAVAGVAEAAGPCWAAAARLLVWIPLLAGAADLGEDFCLARTLTRYDLSPEDSTKLNGWPRAASILARVKFALLALAVGWAALVLWPLLLP
jgi:hypothetical protein